MKSYYFVYVNINGKELSIHEKRKEASEEKISL